MTTAVNAAKVQIQVKWICIENTNIVIHIVIEFQILQYSVKFLLDRNSNIVIYIVREIRILQYSVG